MSLNASFPVGLVVDWQQPERIELGDDHLKNWLLDTGSLTERVQALCHQFSLELLGQQTLTPQPNELSVLNANGATTYQIREILLCDNDTPWVFARSVIPQAIIDAELSNLGCEPLGKRLFNDARFSRSPFEVGMVNAATLGFNRTAPLWGRRSVFSIEQHHMIVAEVFLPQSPAYQPDIRHEMSS
ncbi:chorismate lyase [Alteromonas sp. D210916BOD_24]|uniref:chorismate--pyruvate lyase family protein n=1 Tax=Alteromonas sp. D210916BOD_24 TaxID=3157618 RepID=UPI00399CCEB4